MKVFLGFLLLAGIGCGEDLKFIAAKGDKTQCTLTKASETELAMQVNCTRDKETLLIANYIAVDTFFPVGDLDIRLIFNAAERSVHYQVIHRERDPHSITAWVAFNNPVIRDLMELPGYKPIQVGEKVRSTGGGAAKVVYLEDKDHPYFRTEYHTREVRFDNIKDNLAVGDTIQGENSKISGIIKSLSPITNTSLLKDGVITWK